MSSARWGILGRARRSQGRRSRSRTAEAQAAFESRYEVELDEDRLFPAFRWSDSDRDDDEFDRPQAFEWEVGAHHARLLLRWANSALTDMRDGRWTRREPTLLRARILEVQIDASSARLKKWPPPKRPGQLSRLGNQLRAAVSCCVVRPLLDAPGPGRRRGGVLVAGVVSDRRRATLRAALGALVLAVHLPSAIPVHGQPRLDAVGVQACTSVTHLISDLRMRIVPTPQARQRLAAIYDLVRTSSTASLRQIAAAQAGQIALADDSLLFVMAEQLRSFCR